MTRYTGVTSSNGYYVFADVTETSVNSANNTSTVHIDLYLGNGNNRALGWNSTGSINIDTAPSVQTKSITKSLFNTSTSYNSSVFVDSADFTVTHNFDGSKSLYFICDFQNTTQSNSYNVPYVSVNGYFALTNFSRPPQAPAAPTITRTGDGTTVTITSAVAADATGVNPKASVTAVTKGSVSTVYTVANTSSIGDQITISGSNPSGYNATAALITARTPTTITIAKNTSALSSYVSGGIVEFLPPTITDYKYRWSTTGTGSWTEVTGMGTSRTQDFGPTSPVTVSGTQVYYFQTAAINSEGSSPWSANGIAYAAPSITSITKNGTSATVTVTPASSDGGSTVTFYTVEYSIDQSTWVGGQSIFGASGGSTTFTSLPAGKTYYFRAYATNAIPVNSPYQYNLSTGSTASIYISAYGKRYATSGAITNITTSGGDITYTSSNSFSANDTVTITGVTPSQYNLTNATIKSATSTQFVITNSATGTIQNPKTGTASGWATITTAKRLESVVSYTSFGTVTKLYADSSETNIARYYSATANTVNIGDIVTVTGISSPYSASNTSNATVTNVQNQGDGWYFEIFGTSDNTNGIVNVSGTYYVGANPFDTKWVTISSAQKYTNGAWTSFN